jgi:hypothetical protein
MAARYKIPAFAGMTESERGNDERRAGITQYDVTLTFEPGSCNGGTL